MVNVLILLKLGIIRFYQIKYLRTIFKICFMQVHSSLFFFPLRKIALGPFIQVLY